MVSISLLTLAIGEIKIWNIFYEYFIYKPDSLDENDDCFHLHNLKTGSLYLVEDFIKDSSCKPIYLIIFTVKYLGYTENVFYIAN